jgi:hypothetical protein
MSYAVNPVVPKNLENTAIQYWTGVYKGDAKLIGETLDPEVTVSVYDEMRGKTTPKVTLTGREGVVAQALNMTEVVKSIQNFGLQLAVLKDDSGGKELLAVRFNQKLTEKAPDTVIHLSECELWRWKVEKDGEEEKIVFTAGMIFKKDGLAKYLSNPRALASINAIVIDGENDQAVPVSNWLIMNCQLL